MGSTGRRLFIGGTPGIELRHRELEEIFGKIGPLCDVLVLQGFAFIEFVNLPDAERAVSELHSFQACGGRLSVQYARPPRPKDPSRFAPPYG
ncbi:BQ2448_4218 [Microbotryum intermedium]|uniref:BQ2448_4218 protein n=1 Tax=Microbotryum intermedium TaxID=269621 RepID=A0A238FKL1_9BASI|nr:BQ2448_4218 [Microbotryum intermedium]